MAKKSAVERNKKRKRMTGKFASRRASLKTVINDRDLPPEDRFAAQLKLSKMPRNGSKTRIRNRCEMTGRPRGFYRKFKLSRIALRDLASLGLIPGVTKSSW